MVTASVRDQITHVICKCSAGICNNGKCKICKQDIESDNCNDNCVCESVICNKNGKRDSICENTCKCNFRVRCPCC